MLSRHDLVSRIFKNKNPVSFREYVNCVLHDPECGYYGRNKKRPGIFEDFYTAPEMSKAFGMCMAGFILSLFRFFPADEKVALIEIGGGRGVLMHDIVSLFMSLPVDKKRVEIIFVEQNEGFLNEAREKLSTFPLSASYYKSLDEVPVFDCGIIISNEFFDALPFSRVRIKSGAPAEIFVRFDEGRIYEVENEELSREVSEIYNRWFSEITGDGEVEIVPAVSEVTGEMSKAIKRGAMITVDYGDLAHRLYSVSNPRGTMRCYRKHEVINDPYSYPGEQDITCSVNFSEIIYQAEQHGFRLADFTNQRSFTQRWGILDFISSLAGSGKLDIKKYNEIQQAKNIIIPGGMGDVFKVLFLEKGITREGLRCYSGYI